MTKKTLTFINAKDKKILYIGAIIFTIALALFGINKVLVYQDGRRFAEADQKQQMVFDELVQAVGTPIQVTDKNACYNSEQGPYDNGVLWCQVASAAYYAEKQSEGSLRAAWERVLSENRLPSEQTDANGLVFNAAKGIICILRVYNDYSATRPGFFLPENLGSKQTFVIDCADRAKAKHYPYID